MSRVSRLYDNKAFLPRFRDVANVIQLHTAIPVDHFEKVNSQNVSDAPHNYSDNRSDSGNDTYDYSHDRDSWDREY